MIYNVNTVIASMESLVGFDSRDGFNLPSTLTTKTLTMNTFHPLLALDTLDNIRPEGQILSDFLIDVRKTSISSLINDVINIKLSKESLKSKLSETKIFDSTARFTNQENKLGRFVGWTFRPAKSTYLQHKITEIAFQSLETVTNLTIYVYHSSQKEAITTRTIATTKPISVNWVELETPIILDYSSVDAGGYYFIGYYEDDLAPTNKAIFKDHDLTVAPCGSCNIWNLNMYKNWSNYLKINTAYVESTDLDGTDMVSNELVQYQSDKNYGLNFKLETYCDLTDFMTSHTSLFAHALQIKYAINLLKFVEMSPLRNNRVTDQMKEESFIAVNGTKSENNYIKVRGLIHDYEDALKGLNFDLSRLDPVCLPSTRTGIRWNKSSYGRF